MRRILHVEVPFIVRERTYRDILVICMVGLRPILGSGVIYFCPYEPGTRFGLPVNRYARLRERECAYMPLFDQHLYGVIGSGAIQFQVHVASYGAVVLQHDLDPNHFPFIGTGIAVLDGIIEFDIVDLHIRRSNGNDLSTVHLIPVIAYLIQYPVVDHRRGHAPHMITHIDIEYLFGGEIAETGEIVAVQVIIQVTDINAAVRHGGRRVHITGRLRLPYLRARCGIQMIYVTVP